MYIRRLSGLLKELKKIFRRRRKLGLSFVFLVFVSAALIAAVPQERIIPVWHPTGELESKAAASSIMSDTETNIREELAAFLAETDVIRQVEVYTLYVCGEERQSYGRMSSKQILELMEQHPSWQVEQSEEDLVVFYEHVEDLSDRCKESAYIGIDEMDHLTLFEGMPNQDNVIRTFFQIDIEYLKTSLPQEAVDSLYNGIRISDLAQYNSVISTFSEFAVEEAEQAAGATIGE